MKLDNQNDRSQPLNNQENDVGPSSSQKLKTKVTNFFKPEKMNGLFVKSVKRVTSDFKTYFHKSVRIAPPINPSSLIFKWNFEEEGYDFSCLDIQWIREDDFWKPHFEKIQEFIGEINQLKDIDVMKIPCFRFATIIYVTITAFAIMILMYVLNIFVDLGTWFWLIFLPILFLGYFMLLFFIYKLQRKQLNKRIGERGKEVYLKIHEYNASYFSENELCIHPGLYSAWLDITKMTAEEKGQDGEMLNKDILERSMMMDQSQYYHVKEGKRINDDLQASHVSFPMPVQNDNPVLSYDIYNKNNPKEQKPEAKTGWLHNSMTASVFFPTAISQNSFSSNLHSNVGSNINQATSIESQSPVVNNVQQIPSRNSMNNKTKEHKSNLDIKLPIPKMSINILPIHEEDNEEDSRRNTMAPFPNLAADTKICVTDSFDIPNEKDEEQQQKIDDDEIDGLDTKDILAGVKSFVQEESIILSDFKNE